MQPYLVSIVLATIMLVLTGLFVTGRFGNRRYRDNLARHPLSTRQRLVAMLAVVLWLASVVFVGEVEAWWWNFALLAGPLTAFGVWAWWERDEPEYALQKQESQ